MAATALPHTLPRRFAEGAFFMLDFRPELAYTRGETQKAPRDPDISRGDTTMLHSSMAES